MPDAYELADRADMIVDGYAFVLQDGGVSVVNLYHPERASFFMLDGQLTDTSMDDIEIGIVRDYLMRNKAFLGDDVA